MLSPYRKIKIHLKLVFSLQDKDLTIWIKGGPSIMNLFQLKSNTIDKEKKNTKP